MPVGSEIREVTFVSDRIAIGEEVRADIRYRVRDAEPVLSLEVPAGYTVSPEEIPIPRTRTEARVSFVLGRDEGGQSPGSDPELCVVTFHLGLGAMMDANLWIEG